MARSTSRSSSRPATSSRPQSSFNKQPERPHSTAAVAPVPTATQAPIQVAQSGMLSNILQTAAGVAVGHTVGRAISGLFDGGSNNSQVVDSSSTPSNSSSLNSSQNIQCQADTKRFIDCMSQNYDDVAACQHYLEMMKQCQKQFA